METKEVHNEVVAKIRMKEDGDMLSYAHKIFFISYSLTTIMYAI